MVDRVPPFQEYMNPIIIALKQLGGSASNAELNDKVVSNMQLPNRVLSVPHGTSATTTEVNYRMAWARTYMKKYGILENSTRAVWSLTPAYRDAQAIDADQIIREVRAQQRHSDPQVDDVAPATSPEEELSEEIEKMTWRMKLKDLLLQLEPAAFERLTQRLLRESGFSQVEVLGRSGDGGIDGKGILRLNGLMSFHMLFQCKRYQGSVGSVDIRNFRGAMQGRADKGLFITTGTFTREAVKEAIRDGVPPIELVDGEQLLDMLKDLGMGVQPITDFAVDTDWYEQI